MSDRTASFLGEEFELEPGYGETRDDAIKTAGLKTFLIKKVLKQVSQILEFAFTATRVYFE